MSDPTVFNRRDFLKLVGVGVAGTAAGCAKPPADKLIPFLVAPQDILPGVPYFYASTCRECPVGCGTVVRTREGRAIKVEGNPLHPVGQGGLCARGQAGLQGLYDPDRIATPMIKSGGAWKKATWDEAIAAVGEKLKAAGPKVAVVTGNETGSLHRLVGEWVTAARGRHLVTEAFAYESVREANRANFGRAEIPVYDLSKARGVISFGADFLETFGRPVEQARGFAAMRAKKDDGAGWFVTVEPRLSSTGCNADEWVAPTPGTEAALALGMAHVILAEGLARQGQGLAGLVAAYTPEAVSQQTGVPAETVQRLARLFAKTSPTLAIAGGISTQGDHGTALVAATNLLNWIAGNVGQTLRFDRTLNFDAVASFAQVREFAGQMAQGAFDVVLVHGTNPVYALPAWSGFAEGLAKVPYKVAIATHLDETAEACDVLLPATHALETIGDAETVRGVHSLQQPTMKPVPMFDARSAGDVFIALGTAAALPLVLAATWADYLSMQWRPMLARYGAGRDWETFWGDTLKQGGVWDDVPSPAVSWQGAPAFAVSSVRGDGDLSLIVRPSNNFHDGRGANKSWLQELPDMVSKAAWGSWVEVHPETAQTLGVSSGDPVKVTTAAGSAELPAYVYGGVRKDTIAIALGQGHTAYGRYARGRGVNPVTLLSDGMDAASGALAYHGVRARLSRGSKAAALARTQLEMGLHGREIAQIIPLVDLLKGEPETGPEQAHGKERGFQMPGHFAAGEGVHVGVDGSMTRPGEHTEPLQRPNGYVPPAHSVSAAPLHPVRGPRRNPVDVGSYKNAKHRWAMAIDLNACTACAACVVACYAENNVPVVGPDLVMRGRDMAWIRIDRFEERVAPGAIDVRLTPMMCQHCSDAPCEIVCPVYATYHNPEGLNAQVYNRCVGTRYCSNNCPYKVRAFNFFDYSATEKPTFAFPAPLNWQLNPDVTVRSKGVMEKCTMCIQRILEGKGNARDENRPLRDREIQTACEQSCPTQAITFGDLLDAESAVHQKSYGERKYWVLEELNTKPGVTYLQRVTRDTLANEAHA